VPFKPLDQSVTDDKVTFRRVGMYSVGSSSDSVMVVNDEFDRIGTASMSGLFPLGQHKSQVVISIV
jgi:hypothetical protein